MAAHQIQPVTYREVLLLALPIMVGSAVQNIIALTDQYFLGHAENEVWTGAIGYAGVFYLIITAIGYGFSKGGQIMVARLVGEDRLHEIGKVTYGMLVFQMFLAVLFFGFVKFAGRWFFERVVASPDVLEACLSFLDYRIYGVFFSCIGVSLVALYSGLGRTKAIIYNALGLGVVNMAANYAFVFGRWGMPAMGIAGSGLASALAEAAATLIFIVWMLSDYKNLRLYGFMGNEAAGQNRSERAHDETWMQWALKEIEMIIAQFKISLPIVIQSAVGLGSWFVFFTVIENVGGERALNASSVMRAVYLLFMIPCWGLSSAINTISSRLMGEQRQSDVIHAIFKTAMLSMVITAIACVLLWIFPQAIFSVGTDKPEALRDAMELTWVLVLALLLYSFSAVYFNGLIGTGATRIGLYLQVSSVAVYMIYVYFVVYSLHGSLVMAWTSELLYWAVLCILTYLYLRSGKWKSIKISPSESASGADFHL